MVDLNWIQSTPVALVMVVLTSVGIYLALMILTRLAGLRSFSKMSSFDFTITVAIGSLIATVVLSKDPPLVQGGFALAVLFAIQFSVSFLRSRSVSFAHIVDNDPLLLMAGDTVLHDNLRAARVTVNDLRAKLREANVIHPDEIRAVVMETTGDISVLHARPEGADLALGLLEEVRGTKALSGLSKVESQKGPTLER